MRLRPSSRISWPLLLSLTLLLGRPLAGQMGPAQQSTTRGLMGVDSTGQLTYSISGRVLDDTTGKVIEGALVVLGTFTEMNLQEVYVDSTGGFVFSDLRRGTYYVTASRPGYEEKREMVEVMGAPAAGVFLYLRPKAPTAPPPLIEPLDVAGQLIPKEARKEFERGAAEVRQHNPEEALAHFEKALALYPKYVSALHARGIVLLRLREVDKARVSFEQAVELNPNVEPPRVLLGGIYNALHRYPEAQQQLLRAVQLKPDSWLAHFELSRAYWAQKNLAGAEEEIIRAHELNPSVPQVHLMRANVFLARQDYQGAIGEMDEFLKLVPGGPLADNVRQQRAQLEQRAAGAPPH